jgi:hypothetical protein
MKLQRIIIKQPSGHKITSGVTNQENVERIKQFYLEQFNGCTFEIIDVN